jgi:hypothetical protein
MFVLEMLRSSNFSRLLTAARECLHMVDRAAEVLKAGEPAALQVRGPAFSANFFQVYLTLC